MPVITPISSVFGRAFAAYNEHRQRVEEERLTELQYARHMRTRAEPGSADFYYYNAIVVRCGGR